MLFVCVMLVHVFVVLYKVGSANDQHLIILCPIAAMATAAAAAARNRNDSDSDIDGGGLFSCLNGRLH